MKVIYNGREIPEEYARFLEDNGQAHVGQGWSGDDGGTIIMESGPGNNWLEKQDPKLFLTHVFGHTCTWREMAKVWADEGHADMFVVHECLQTLNTVMLAALQERRERVGEAEALASRT